MGPVFDQRRLFALPVSRLAAVSFESEPKMDHNTHTKSRNPIERAIVVQYVPIERQC